MDLPVEFLIASIITNTIEYHPSGLSTNLIISESGDTYVITIVNSRTLNNHRETLEIRAASIGYGKWWMICYS